MAFAFTVHFAKGVKKEGNIPNKKRKKREPTFSTEQEIADKTKQPDDLLKNSVTKLLWCLGGYR